MGLSTDEFNAVKGKKSFYSYEQRKKILEAIRYVDLVIPEDNWGQKSKILKSTRLIFLLWEVTGKINSTS